MARWIVVALLGIACEAAEPKEVDDPPDVVETDDSPPVEDSDEDSDPPEVADPVPGSRLGLSGGGGAVSNARHRLRITVGDPVSGDLVGDDGSRLRLGLGVTQALGTDGGVP